MRAAERVVVCLALGRDVDVVPAALLDQPAREVILRPSGHDQHDGRGRRETSTGRLRPPLPRVLPVRLRIRLSATLHGVVKDEAVVDEYLACKEVAVAFHLEVIDRVADSA